jgi:myo-inositol-1(or 4)-monophosphatase
VRGERGGWGAREAVNLAAFPGGCDPFAPSRPLLRATGSAVPDPLTASRDRGFDPAALAAASLEAAEAATAVHLRHLGRVRVGDARDKGTYDFVSAVDLEAQEAALGVILERFPGADILAEEEGSGDDGARTGTPLWIVDPLDGTTNFLHGHPAFCASVGVVVDGAPVAGAVVAGRTGERFTGWQGGGAWRSRGGAGARPEDIPLERIGTSEVTALRQALVGTGFPFKRPDEIEGYLPELGRLLRLSSGVRREGAAALDLCRLAEGTLDAFWEGWLAPWDVAGGLAILAAAGGTWCGPGGARYEVTRGGPLRAANGSGLLEALNQALQEPVREG